MLFCLFTPLEFSVLSKMPSITQIAVFLTFCVVFSVCKDPVDPCFWPYVNDSSDNYQTPSSWKINCTNVCGQFPDYMACLDETCNLGSLKIEGRETFRYDHHLIHLSLENFFLTKNCIILIYNLELLRLHCSQKIATSPAVLSTTLSLHTAEQNLK